MTRIFLIALIACVCGNPTAVFATDWCTADAKPKWAKVLPSWNNRSMAPMSSADTDFGFEPIRVWCWARDGQNSRDGWCIGLGNELCLQGGVDRSAIQTDKYEHLHITNQDTNKTRFVTLFYD
jgi:hypothetical protein